MDLGFGPDEWLGVLVVTLDEGIDVRPELFDRIEGGAVQRFSFQDREPDFDLVEPRGPRRGEMEVNVGVALEPTIGLGLVRVEVVEDDMNGCVRISGDDIVHEVEEFDAPSALLVSGGHLAGGHFEGGEQRRGAVALIVVAVTGQRSAIRKLQIALRSLQRLDRGLLVDADHNRILGWRHVEPDYIGRLSDKFGVIALTPGLAPGEVNLLCAQKAPDNGVIRQMLDDIIANDIAQAISIPIPAPQDRLLPPRARIASCLRAHPTGFALLISEQTLEKQACIPRNTILIEQRTYPLLDHTKRRRPQRKRLFNRRWLRPRSSNHGCPWIQKPAEKATVVLSPKGQAAQAHLVGVTRAARRSPPVAGVT